MGYAADKTPVVSRGSARYTLFLKTSTILDSSNLDLFPTIRAK